MGHLTTLSSFSCCATYFPVSRWPSGSPTYTRPFFHLKVEKGGSRREHRNQFPCRACPAAQTSPKMTSAVQLDNDAITNAGLTDAEHHGIHNNPARGSMDVRKASVARHSVRDVELVLDEDYEGKPTEEEMHTLRRVSGRIMWSMWTIAFVELCERFSYYGSSVLYTNFINRPLPPGSTTGAGAHPGALGMGPKAAQGLSLFNMFFAYLMPLVG